LNLLSISHYLFCLNFLFNLHFLFDLFASIFKISIDRQVNLYSGALFIKIALGWNLYYSVLLVLAMTGLSALTGGLAAVIYTETLQSFIMISGGLTLMAFAFKEIGGLEQLYIKYMNAIPARPLNYARLSGYSNASLVYETCGTPKENSFQMLRHITDPDMPWLGFLLGFTLFLFLLLNKGFLIY
jgi:Na+/pantothenate symporter